MSCRRRSRLNTSAMVSKVSSTLGLSSASMAASDIEFSRSSSSRSGSPSTASEIFLAVGSPCAIARLRLERRGGGRRRRRRHRLRRLRRCGGCGTSPARRAAAPRRRIAGRIAGRHRRRHLLGVGAGIGRFEIDDVAQENFAFVQFVAPDDDGLEGERALAQAGDHGLAAGLDALGDGDLALTRKKFHRAHFAQIHPHRIVGALGRLLRFGFGRRFRRDLDQFAGLGLLLFGLLARLFFLLGFGFLGLHDVDAHLAHHRQHVLDLLGGDLLRRHDRVELLIGDVAALLGLLDHLLDGGVGEIEQRQRGVGGLGRLLLRRLAFLLRGGLGLGRDRLGAHALACHVCLHERLSLPPRFRPCPRVAPTPGRRLRSCPYPMVTVPRRADGPHPWPGPLLARRPTAKKGSAVPAPPESRPLSCRGTPLSSD